MTTEHYLNAAFNFRLNGNKTMEYELLTDALLDASERCIAWYEIGLFYFRQFKAKNDRNAVDLAIACFKKALQIEPDNFIILLELSKINYFIENCYELIRDMEPVKMETLIAAKIDITDEILIQAFNQIKKPYLKSAMISSISQTRDIKYYGLLEYCALNTENPNLCRIVLKRISFFKDKRDLKALFQKIIENGTGIENDPIFNLAMEQSNCE